jgi:anti-sigma factor ChrR (cupin superfamily)
MDGHSAMETDAGPRAGAQLVRTGEMPWADLRIGAYKSLRRSAETGWSHGLIRGYPGQVNAPHTHQGPAMFYVIEGGFDFRGGSATVGDWVWESMGAVHEATAHTADTVYLGTLFGPVGMHDDTGKPPGYGDPLAAAVVHTGDLPWLDDGHGGEIRVLRVSPETGWIHLMLRARAGQARAPHTCLGPCEMFVLEGQMDYAGGRAGAGDWIWEPAGSRQDAMGFPTDALVLVNLYGPALFGQGDLLDWRAAQALARGVA